MSSCIDWRTALRPASFRGVPFYVESDEADYGRRLVVHQFPNRDAPFVEDMGEAAPHYSFHAYVAGDAALGLKAALVGACRRRGPGTLVLPTDGGVTVRCKSCKRSQELDRQGYIAFKLEFVDNGASLFASPIGLLEALVGGAALAAVGWVVGAFSAVYSTVRADAWLIASAAGAIRGAIAAIDDARSSVVMTVEAAPVLLRQLTDLAYQVDDVAAAGPDVVAADTGTDLSTTSRAAVPSLPVAMADIVNTLRVGAVDELAAIRALWPLTSYGRPDPLPASDGIAEAQDAANVTAVNALVRRLALVELAVAVAAADFPDRETAVLWRARIAEALDDEIATADGPLVAALGDVRGRAALAISRKLADLQPIITLEAKGEASAIVWAWRLYSDANQAPDLVARNRVRHPSYMPRAFAALAGPVNVALTRGERNLREVV